ncbi:MAG: hypothetical protein Q9184_003858 [Pyrenodesmia sp. 2 TL-2023]
MLEIGEAFGEAESTMAKQKKPKTWAEEIAELNDPAPQGVANNRASSVEDSEDDNKEAKEHYFEVDKSRIRKSTGINLGPEYSGSHISRSSLNHLGDLSDDDPFASAQSRQGSPSGSSSSGEYADPEDADLDMDQEIGEDEEIDSDEAFGAEDGMRFQDFVFRGSSGSQNASPKNGIEIQSKPADILEDGESSGFSGMESEDMEAFEAKTNFPDLDDRRATETVGASEQVDAAEDVEMEDQDDTSFAEEGMDSNASTSTTDDESPPPPDDDRAALRKMMAESQKTIASNLSKAAKADIAKGRAIKHQQDAFNRLVNTRMQLQKALTAINSLQLPSSSPSTTPDPAIQAAEQAALKLWSTLDSLRQSLHPISTSSKAPTPPETSLQPDPTTPLSTLWSRMQSHETHSRPHRTTTLNKWAAKIAPPSALSQAKKFSAPKPQQTLSAVLEQQLQSSTTMAKLIAKTQIPRQVAANDADPSSPTTDALLTYDDTPFYTLLLRDLVFSAQSSSTIDPPLAATATLPIPGINDRVRKKQVDTKASKGRKIRYTVHEKLQSFMAPEDRGRWGDRQREELMRGLLGRKVVDVEERVVDGEDEASEGERAEEGLRLFR